MAVLDSWKLLPVLYDGTLFWGVDRNPSIYGGSFVNGYYCFYCKADNAGKDFVKNKGSGRGTSRSPWYGLQEAINHLQEIITCCNTAKNGDTFKYKLFVNGTVSINMDVNGSSRIYIPELSVKNAGFRIGGVEIGELLYDISTYTPDECTDKQFYEYTASSNEYNPHICAILSVGSSCASVEFNIHSGVCIKTWHNTVTEYGARVIHEGVFLDVSGYVAVLECSAPYGQTYKQVDTGCKKNKDGSVWYTSYTTTESYFRATIAGSGINRFESKRCFTEVVVDNCTLKSLKVEGAIVTAVNSTLHSLVYVADISDKILIKRRYTPSGWGFPYTGSALCILSSSVNQGRINVSYPYTQISSSGFDSLQVKSYNSKFYNTHIEYDTERAGSNVYYATADWVTGRSIALSGYLKNCSIQLRMPTIYPTESFPAYSACTVSGVIDSCEAVYSQKVNTEKLCKEQGGGVYQFFGFSHVLGASELDPSLTYAYFSQCSETNTKFSCEQVSSSYQWTKSALEKCEEYPASKYKQALVNTLNNDVKAANESLNLGKERFEWVMKAYNKIRKEPYKDAYGKTQYRYYVNVYKDDEPKRYSLIKSYYDYLYKNKGDSLIKKHVVPMEDIVFHESAQNIYSVASIYHNAVGSLTSQSVELEDEDLAKQIYCINQWRKTLSKAVSTCNSMDKDLVDLDIVKVMELKARNEIAQVSRSPVCRYELCFSDCLAPIGEKRKWKSKYDPCCDYDEYTRALVDYASSLEEKKKEKASEKGKDKDKSTEKEKKDIIQDRKALLEKLNNKYTVHEAGTIAEYIRCIKNEKYNDAVAKLKHIQSYSLPAHIESRASTIVSDFEEFCTYVVYFTKEDSD